MTHDIMDFIEYIHNEKQTSKNTEVSYERDLRKMNEYLEAQNVYGVSAVTETNLNAYVMFLEREGRKPATVSRSIASMKAFFHFLEKERRIESDPAWRLKAPKIEKTMPRILTTEEVTLLLEQPSGNTPKELRDKAMLELLYATGIRVSELISLKVSDLNLQMEYVICTDIHKERIIPFGNVAKGGTDKIYAGWKRSSDQPGGLSVAVYELYRWCNEPSGFLETDQVLWEEGGDRIGDHTAYAAPFVCGTSDQQWSRFKVGAGDVRTF